MKIRREIYYIKMDMKSEKPNRESKSRMKE
jgi:hypothetical protein